MHPKIRARLGWREERFVLVGSGGVCSVHVGQYPIRSRKPGLGRNFIRFLAEEVVLSDDVGLSFGHQPLLGGVADRDREQPLVAIVLELRAEEVVAELLLQVSARQC